MTNKTIQQLGKTPCLDDHQLKGTEFESVGRVPKMCPQMCSEMSLFDTHCWTKHSRVNKQTCTSIHKMDQILRQTLGSFGFFFALHRNSDSAGHLENLESTSGGNLVWTSHVCSHKLDVQETKLHSNTVRRNLKYFLEKRLAHGWNSRSRSPGSGC